MPVLTPAVYLTSLQLNHILRRSENGQNRVKLDLYFFTEETSIRFCISTNVNKSHLHTRSQNEVKTDLEDTCMRIVNPWELLGIAIIVKAFKKTASLLKLATPSMSSYPRNP